MIQGGAGTSTNMNANEVIANRALELLGHRRANTSTCIPIRPRQPGQSTNDVYPTAIRSRCVGIARLLDAMASCAGFEAKADEFTDILKMGRTQLQDAVPMTLGQEFSTFAVMIGEDEQRLREAAALIYEINMGATAIGTGINADPRVRGAGYAHLRAHRAAGGDAPNLVEATQDTGAFVQLSGVLKRVAVKLSKTCNDLRLLRRAAAGFGEINLPARAAGSSIMPGKVNPVIPEVVNQVAFEVIGNDVTVTMAAEGGQLQLNAFEPIIAHSLFKSLTHLRKRASRSAQLRARHHRQPRTARRARGPRRPRHGAQPLHRLRERHRVARAALATGRPVADLVLEMGLMKKKSSTRCCGRGCSRRRSTTPPQRAVRDERRGAA